MLTLLGKIIWASGIVCSQTIRWPHLKRNRSIRIIDSRVDLQEKILLLFVYLGMIIVPSIYALTSVFSFADYSANPIAVAAGAFITLLGLWLFYRSHAELGRNWSQSLDVREEHALVSTGIYAKIRHPMYTSMLLWSIAQIALLPNFIAGPIGFVFISLLCVMRIPREERMLQEHFGEEYRRYMQTTKRLVPGIL